MTSLPLVPSVSTLVMFGVTFCVVGCCTGVRVVVGFDVLSSDLVLVPTDPYPVVDSVPLQIDSLSHCSFCTACLVACPK